VALAAYYNENDLFAASWLRELISRGLIAPGDVDERSIADVQPGDLARYAQCHFFAGIGGWSYALRLAGWPDDKPAWTGSCPCQPFSAAGKGEGFADPRHLWPRWERLIRECRPDVIFGEQVDKALAWLDLVCGDLEGEGYATGAAIVGAHSVGAPHRRQRIYWVADGEGNGRREECTIHGGMSEGDRTEGITAGFEPSGGDCGVVQSAQQQVGIPGRARESGSAVAIPDSERRQQERGSTSGNEETNGREGRNRSEPNSDYVVAGNGESGMGHSNPAGSQGRSLGRNGSGELAAGEGGMAGIWDTLEWLPCRDSKSRPVEPGTFPLAHGIPGRVGRLRGYGNAIVPQVAAEFVMAYMEITDAL
jgi:DNA (cytosine-5)-methyltransferase 1